MIEKSTRRVVVTGKTGQLVQALQACALDRLEIISIGRPECDFLNLSSLRPALLHHQPDLLLNAAAYTAVDQAELEEKIAFAVNALAAEELARISAELKIPFIQISTNYVFDGESGRPYQESDTPNPINIYGRSKRAGEEAVLRAHPHPLIVRIGWLYGVRGKNFLTHLLHLGRQQKEICVVADQWGNPTEVIQVAETLVHIIQERLSLPRSLAFMNSAKRAATQAWEQTCGEGCLAADKSKSSQQRLPQYPEYTGLLHLSALASWPGKEAEGANEANWAEFAEALFEEARKLNLYGKDKLTPRILPIGSHQSNRRAQRPKNGRLNSVKFAACFPSPFLSPFLSPWRPTLRNCLSQETELLKKLLHL